jgi:hypothetical protein
VRSITENYPQIVEQMKKAAQQGFTAQRGFPVEFSVRGADWNQLVPLSQKLMADLSASGIVVDLDSDYRVGMPELRVSPDRAVCADVGVSIDEVSGDDGLAWAVEGPEGPPPFWVCEATGDHGFFSIYHVVNIINLFILMGIFYIGSFLFMIKVKLSEKSERTEYLFLLIFGIMTLLFIVLFRTEIGTSRDWDILAVFYMGIIIAAGTLPIS